MGANLARRRLLFPWGIWHQRKVSVMVFLVKERQGLPGSWSILLDTCRGRKPRRMRPVLVLFCGPLAAAFHNRPQSGAVYEPVSQRLLPLDVQWQEGLAKVGWPTATLPEVMGSGSTTLRSLIRGYLFISLFRACAESLASENASRLATMERADKNIDELLESLNGSFHRLRQGGIDEELFDVISGFEALVGTGQSTRISLHPERSSPGSG